MSSPVHFPTEQWSRLAQFPAIVLVLVFPSFFMFTRSTTPLQRLARWFLFFFSGERKRYLNALNRRRAKLFQTTPAATVIKSLTPPPPLTFPFSTYPGRHLVIGCRGAYTGDHRHEHCTTMATHQFLLQCEQHRAGEPRERERERGAVATCCTSKDGRERRYKSAQWTADPANLSACHRMTMHVRTCSSKEANSAVHNTQAIVSSFFLFSFFLFFSLSLFFFFFFNRS